MDRLVASRESFGSPDILSSYTGKEYLLLGFCGLRDSLAKGKVPGIHI